MTVEAVRPATQAVFFDVDFTLIYPGPMFRGEGYQAFCARYGMEVDPSKFEDGVASAARLPPGDHRGGRQERPHHLGVAGEEPRIRIARIVHAPNPTISTWNLPRLRAQCENAEQVRPAGGHPD